MLKFHFKKIQMPLGIKLSLLRQQNFLNFNIDTRDGNPPSLSSVLAVLGKNIKITYFRLEDKIWCGRCRNQSLTMTMVSACNCAQTICISYNCESALTLTIMVCWVLCRKPRRHVWINDFVLYFNSCFVSAIEVLMYVMGIEWPRWEMAAAVFYLYYFICVSNFYGSMLRRSLNAVC